MKIYLTILAVFLCVSVYAQTNNYAITYDGKLVTFNNNIITYEIDSTNIGLIADWSTQYENHADSLTFNSTGLTITGISGSDVTMSAVTGLKVGHSCRFTTALSGTIYTILAINSLTLTLDQTCTASTTDELFHASYGSLYDGSGNNNTAIQTTGSKQAKTFWFNTDTSKFDLDGVNDLYDISSANDNVNISTGSIIYWINLDDVISTSVIMGFKVDDNNSIQTFWQTSLIVRYRGGGTTTQVVQTPPVGMSQVVMTWNTISDEFKMYIDGSQAGSTQSGLGTLVGSFTIYSSIGANQDIGGAIPIEATMDDIKVYNRTLSSTQIQTMYQNSRFTP